MNNQQKIKSVEEDLKDWIETCLDADAHGGWVRAPSFSVIEDVAELLAPRLVKRDQARDQAWEERVRGIREEERLRSEKVVKDYGERIQKLHEEMVGDVAEATKHMLAYDIHSRLIAVKHILQSLTTHR